MIGQIRGAIRKGLWVACLLGILGSLGTWVSAAPPTSRPVPLAGGQPPASRQAASRPTSQQTNKAVLRRVAPRQVASEKAKNTVVASTTSQKDKKKNAIAGMIAQQFRDEFWNKGPLLALLLIFGAGFLVSLTPCVYPMIPITIAVIGANSAKKEGERAHAFFLSLMYVLGMAVPAAILGAVVALIGKQPFMMGALMQSTFFVVFLTLLFLLMAFSMFGMFDLALPSSLQTRLSMIQGRGYLGVFVLGMIGIVLSTPCSGPAMIGLLAFVAQTGSVFWGIVLPTVMAFGIGVPFLLLGTGFVAALPRSGVWMTEVKKVFGVVFLGAAFLYGKGLFAADPTLYSMVVGIVLVALGIFAGALRSYQEADSTWVRLKQVFGVLSLLAGGVLFVQIWLHKGYLLPKAPAHHVVGAVGQHQTFAQGKKSAQGQTSSVQGTQNKEPVDPAVAACLPPANYPANKPFWLTDEAKGMECAKRLNRPVILDFWAEWCTACKRLESISFADPTVVKESRRFVMLKLEQTAGSAEGERLEKKYSIQGLPWVRFVDGKGNILQKPLIIGFKSPKELLTLMRQVR
ncbi:MAG: thioredoxin family protein [Myxococcales bacterium]|nr:thioredoxin family protein [Myxococcales bacterium]